MAKEAQAMKGMSRTFCRDHGEKIEKVVRFGAFWCMAVGSADVCEAPRPPSASDRTRFFRASSCGLSAPRCIKRIEKVMQNDAK